MPDMVSDTISGKMDWQQREIGKLSGRCAPGDVLGGRLNSAILTVPKMVWASTQALKGQRTEALAASPARGDAG